MISRKPVLLSILFCIVFTLLFMAMAYSKTILPSLPERWMHAVCGIVAGLLTTFIFLRWQRMYWSDIGLLPDGRTALRFFSGMALGLLVMGVLAVGVLRIAAVDIIPNPQSSIRHFILSSLYLLPLAFLEELSFRGYPLAIHRGCTSPWISIGLTSLLFALYHVAGGWN